MASSTTQQGRRIALAMFAGTLIGATGCTEEHWSDSHMTGTRLLATAPECPQVWDTIPVFLATKTDSERVAAGGASSVPGYSALAATGPITDIPEFHDCQKFIVPGIEGHPSQYQSLFAIFAAYKLDSIVGALSFDNTTWSSSNISVATVDASGRVTGVSPGTVVINATSTVAQNRRASLAVTVTTNAPPVKPVPVVAPGPGVSVRVGDSFSVAATLGAPTTTSLPVGEIYTYGAGYDALGIGPNFNCLFLYFDATGNLSAKVVNVGLPGSNGKACFDASNFNDQGRPLEVFRTPGLADSDYPPAARWDWDPVNNRQYIGIKCGAAWCEIGSRGARPFTVSAGHAPELASTITVPRVLGVKGWYDEQFLAVKDGSGQFVPSGLKGIVIPDPDLVSKHKGNFDQKWVHVAYVGLDTMTGAPEAAKYYKQKFNFDPVPAQLPLTHMNMLSMCYGTRSDCHVPSPPPAEGCGPEQKLPFIWFIKRVWVRLDAPSGGRPMYRCVTRRDHAAGLPPNGTNPATARFRWLALDETTWNYCEVAGCCEADGNQRSVGWQ